MKTKNLMTRLLLVPALLLCVTAFQGCTVVKVVDAAASTAVGVTKATVKTTGKVAGAVIPDGKKSEKE